MPPFSGKACKKRKLRTGKEKKHESKKISAWTSSLLLGLTLFGSTVAGASERVADQSKDPWFAPLPKVMPAPRYADHGADNFYKSSKVTRKPVTFKNQFNMKVAGNLYIPKTYQKGQKLPAVLSMPRKLRTRAS